MLEQEYEITNEFKGMVDDATEDQPLKEYLQGVVDYGQDQFVYYLETTKMYDEYKSDCDDWLYNQVEETGLKPWNLFRDWDYVPDSEQNKWNVVVAMFEEYCEDRLEELEN